MSSFDEYTEENDASWSDDLDGAASTDDDNYVSPLSSGEVEEVEFEDAAEEETESEPTLDDIFSDESDTDFDFNEIVDAEPLDSDEPVSGVVVLASENAVEVTISQPLSKEEAEQLTEHIRSTADVLYVLIARAHAGQAWKPLGYSSFEKYVKAEFDISRSRAYQFLNQAHVIDAITAAAPEGTHIKISEAAARDLKNFVDELAPDISRSTEGLSGSEAGDVVEDLVNEYRERSKKPIDEDDTFDLDGVDLDDIEFDMPEFDNDGGGGQSKGSEFDGLDNLDDLDDILGDKTEGFDEDPLAFRNKIENVYAFYTALSALDKMPPVSEIVSSIPEARRAHINQTLPKAIAWLNEFVEEWTKEHGNQESADENSAEITGEAAEENNEFSEDFEDFADIENEKF
ncbi:MAG TPA: hypothetical protein VLS94_09680 [Fusibacter sp.]|nr:hypothetical protein [Fusibacter sp.]